MFTKTNSSYLTRDQTTRLRALINIITVPPSLYLIIIFSKIRGIHVNHLKNNNNLERTFNLCFDFVYFSVKNLKFSIVTEKIKRIFEIYCYLIFFDYLLSV